MMTFDKLREMSELSEVDVGRALSEQDLAELGANEIAYVRPILVENQTRFMLLAGDGRQLGVAADYSTAIAAALEHDFQPVSVH